MPSCKSCETHQEFEFRFCPNCGAKVVEKRLKMGELLRDFFQTLFNFEGPVWGTIRDLTIRPRKVTHGYIEGVRSKYLPPIRYLIIAFTISGLFFVIFQDQLEEAYSNNFVSGFEEGYRNYDKDNSTDAESLEMAQEFITRLQYIFQKYANLLGFLYIPLFALFGKWWLNKRNKFNMAESFVMTTYLHSHTAILMMPFYLFMVIPGLNFFVFTSVLAYLIILYFVWLVKQSYQTSIWKSLFTVVFTYILYYFIVGTGIGIYLLITLKLAHG